MSDMTQMDMYLEYTHGLIDILAETDVESLERAEAVDKLGYDMLRKAKASGLSPLEACSVINQGMLDTVEVANGGA